MSQRYLPFNVEALVKVATQAVGANRCVSFEKMGEGLQRRGTLNLKQFTHTQFGSQERQIELSSSHSIREMSLSHVYRFLSPVRRTSPPQVRLLPWSTPVFTWTFPSRAYSPGVPTQIRQKSDRNTSSWRKHLDWSFIVVGMILISEDDLWGR